MSDETRTATCDTCGGSGLCHVCGGTGQLQGQTGSGTPYDRQCPSCATPGNGVCRVCLGSGEEPDTQY